MDANPSDVRLGVCWGRSEREENGGGREGERLLYWTDRYCYFVSCGTRDLVEDICFSISLKKMASLNLLSKVFINNEEKKARSKAPNIHSPFTTCVLQQRHYVIAMKKEHTKK